MNVFLDASAIVAMMTLEETAPSLRERLRGEADVHTSWIGLWEAATAIGRKTGGTAEAEFGNVLEFCNAGFVTIHPEDEPLVRLALTAFDRYGRRSGHPARLNMGDCYSYAFARTLGAVLLFTGNDFAAIEDVR
jgi:ribonuclease VapC